MHSYYINLPCKIFDEEEHMTFNCANTMKKPEIIDLTLSEDETLPPKNSSIKDSNGIADTNEFVRIYSPTCV